MCIRTPHVVEEKQTVKILYTVISEVSLFLGLSVSYIQVEGGVRNKGKVSQFNGLIGMLERSEIDIALADLSLTFTRSEVCSARVHVLQIVNVLHVYMYCKL